MNIIKFTIGKEDDENKFLFHGKNEQNGDEKM